MNLHQYNNTQLKHIRSLILKSMDTKYQTPERLKNWYKFNNTVHAINRELIKRGQNEYKAALN